MTDRRLSVHDSTYEAYDLQCPYSYGPQIWIPIILQEYPWRYRGCLQCISFSLGYSAIFTYTSTWMQHSSCALYSITRPLLSLIISGESLFCDCQFSFSNLQEAILHFILAVILWTTISFFPTADGLGCILIGRILFLYTAESGLRLWVFF
jgi:hypothetical protein